MKPWFKLKALFARKRLERQMRDEMQTHLDGLAERNVAKGMSPEEARFAARREFGGVEQIKERARDERGWVWIEQLWQDLRYAVRALRRSPGFTLTAVLTLALGIGVNAALFVAYNAIALRPLPVREPDELVKLVGEMARKGAMARRYSYPEYIDYRDGNRVFSGLAAVIESALPLGGGSPPDTDGLFDAGVAGTVAVNFVSDNYLTVLGAPMELGRGFRPEENSAPGSSPVIVLSHLFWESHFHGDPTILGKTLMLGRITYTVVGVVAEEFVGHQPEVPAGWIPLMMCPGSLTDRKVQACQLIGRLKPEVTAEQAKADLDLLAGHLAVLFPGNEVKVAVRLEQGMKVVTVPVDARWLAAMAPLLLGFGMVLLIACTNVANLLLARGVARQQEIGVRLALGAGRGRMIRQLLTENLVICVLGAVVGLIMALWTLEFLRPLVVAEFPLEWGAMGRRLQFLSLNLDYRVVGFTALLAGAAALAAGLVPALNASRVDLVSAVKDEGSVFGRRMGLSRLRNFLIIAQVAVCLTLLSCAGLFARNVIRLRDFEVGFETKHLFAAHLRPKAATEMNPAAMEIFRRRATDTVRSFPQVTGVSEAVFGPLIAGSGITAPVRNASAAAPALETSFAFVAPEFFETFGIPLLRGRTFAGSELELGAPSVIISEALAHRLWPEGDAVGKMLAVSDAAFTFPSRATAETFREYSVIGIAQSVRGGLWDTQQTLIYLPLTAQAGANHLQTYVRVRSDASATLAEVVRQAEAAGIDLRFDRPLARGLEEEKLPYRAVAVLSGMIGVLALLMASVGLYGVMSFAVNQRVREIGIRVALGASTERVIGLFLRQGMKLVAIGIGLGLGGGLLFALLLAKVMYGLNEALDPAAFGLVTVILAGIALFACWLPARRAAKVDPMVALRSE